MFGVGIGLWRIIVGTVIVGDRDWPVIWGRGYGDPVFRPLEGEIPRLLKSCPVIFS